MKDKKYYEISGFFGGVCIVFGLAIYFLRREFSLYVMLDILIGIVLSGIFLYYNTARILQSIKKQGRKLSGDILVNTVLIIGIAALINIFSNRFYTGLDLTRDKVTSLSEQSKKIVKWVKEPLEILVFRTAKEDAGEEYLLESYKFQCSRISYRFVDPEKNPQIAYQYGITRTGQGVVKHKDGYIGMNEVTEQNVTNAIIRVTQKKKNTVYFVTGHGEHDINEMTANQGYGLLNQALVDENYDVRQLSLVPPDCYVPGDCTILVVGGPQRMYTSLEMQAVREYLANNGRAVFLLEPYVRTGFEDLIRDWGIKLDDDCLVQVIRSSSRPLLQVTVKDYEKHEITDALKGKSLILSTVRSVSAVEYDEKAGYYEKIRDITLYPLLKSPSFCWGETDLRTLFREGRATKSAEDIECPSLLSILSIKGKEEDNSRIIVTGDSDFVNNEYINQLFNRDFFMNCMAYLGSQASLISVRPRHLFVSRINYKPETMSGIFTFSVLLFPQLFLMAGLAIWWLRR